MTRSSRVLAALALVLAGLLLLPPAATAASGDVVRQLDIAIDIRPDGTLEVTETYDWDFGSREGLGLTRMLDSRFDYAPDPDSVRVYEYAGFAASSPTGAPAGVWSTDEGARVRVDVGAPDGSEDRRSGRQTYVLRYTVDGALNAIRDDPAVPDQDELYWNATGHDWDVPIEQATVTVTGPADVVDHACYQGSRGSTAECASLDADGGEVRAASGRLPSGSGMTVVAAYPPGTFGTIEPILQSAPEPLLWAGDGAAPTAARFVRDNVAWLASLALLGPVLLAALRVRRGRDLHFADLPPGVLPAPGRAPRVEVLRDAPAVAVRFTPPDGLRPGEVGALDEKTATTTHVSATLIDLAVRGFLQIHEAGTGWRGRPNDWLLVATPEAARGDLRDYERTLLEKVFAGRSQVRMSQLRNTFAGTLRTARRQLMGGLAQLFTGHIRAGAGSMLALVRVVVLGLVLVTFGGGIAGAAASGPATIVLVLAVGAVLAAFLLAWGLTRRARLQRSPVGRALHEQSRGFRLYLTTAEGHQLRFEEGEDIFSRYLPYAIVYEAAERWAGIFARLEAQGQQVARPTWYVGTHGFQAGSFTTLGSALSSFSSTAGRTLSSTPGSSGGSGSRGGGGGFSGGGGGGGGGGGR
ncbi:DUF2207 domain-containing protein [Georgenia satyanarayanai]|uniref:DUF2207 domain-containing protein n=1 Tax=Georgenia satyanarayanai TaxID=860221 RepID=UPI00203FC463|nr:DUF2207 domain-containing protein [Georgenia satyanarayanai]MCM3660310.1 DUF2207 domain-containing protein [Georgenia satyanarayanai]